MLVADMNCNIMAMTFTVLELTVSVALAALPMPQNAQAHGIGGQTIDSSVYAHPQALITLAGGRQLNLFCLGHGNPVVVFEAGLGSRSMTWRHVQQPIATITRACSYDRAGYGFSTVSNRPADARNSVDDLHDLLQQAKITLPVVLVGHSRGGQYATLYAELFPRDVAGLILVDPSFTGQDRLQGASQSAEDNRLARLQGCLEQARNGAFAWLTSSNCLDNPHNVDPILHAELNREYSTPEYWATALSETQSAHAADVKDKLSTDDTEMQTTGPHFGAIPLIVLTSEALRSQAWQSGHDALAAASARGSNLFVAHSGHYIQDDQPGAVIDAVTSVVSSVRQEAH